MAKPILERMEIHLRLTRWAILSMFAGFGLWRFADNTADPDLWGHVLYGQRNLALRALERAEPFSWTAEGHPWVNHELLAELTMGAAHLIGGGAALFWLMLGMAFATLLLAICHASRDTGAQLLPWIVALVMAREAAIGFAMRPQIFSALFFVIFIGLLRQLAAGKTAPVLAIPALLCLWINTHGAALLGLVLLWVFLAASLLASPANRIMPRKLRPVLNFEEPSRRILINTGAALVLANMAVGLTPYGYDLLRWLIDSVRYVRPEITEWNPAPVGASHLLFFLSFPVFAALALATRHTKRPWEIALLCITFYAAIRHQRHIPLYALALICIMPAYLGALLTHPPVRAFFTRHTSPSPVKLLALNALLLLAAAGFLWKGLTARGEHGYRMVVPRDEYPVAAMQFIREANANKPDGNLIVHFNWAQMAIWELPQMRVSFDGRLDTCYPRDLIEEHWRFYHDGEIPRQTFALGNADLVLIPPYLAANDTLAAHKDWSKIYQDPLASVYINTARSGRPPPQTLYKGVPARTGITPFPVSPPARARPHAE